MTIAIERAGGALGAVSARGRRALSAIVFELAKARLSILVTITTLTGFLLGSSGGVDALKLIAAVAGTALSAGGANAWNQYIEARPDGLMLRTKNRPIPSGRISTGGAALWAWLMSVSGILILAVFTNLLTAGLSLLSILIYVFLYTPLKKRTPACTLIGAISGAIPPLMGWTAATGGVALGGVILFAILFVWQIPHFLALSWLYREDYARGGFRMLSLSDERGAASSRLALVYAAALIPLGLAVTLSGLAGGTYAGASVALGLILLAIGAAFAISRTPARARMLFAGSIVYLLFLMTFMLADRTPPAARISASASYNISASDYR